MCMQVSRNDKNHKQVETDWEKLSIDDVMCLINKDNII